MHDHTALQAAPTPRWAWLFVIACIAIPVASLGGLIPAMLGAGGASGCYGVARSTHISAGGRVAICVVITVACWSAFFAFVALVVELMQ